jgi:hypothetical protein
MEGQSSVELGNRLIDGSFLRERGSSPRPSAIVAQFQQHMPHGGAIPMTKVSDYYSINEAKKPADKQVYHDNDQCIAGRDIPQNERRPGRGGYRHCTDCDK